MIKKFFLFIVIVSSANFFNLFFISIDLMKIIGVLVITFLLISITTKLFIFKNGKKYQVYKNFSKGILIILLSVFISAIPAYLYHSQPILITLVAQRSMYFYLLFFYIYLYNNEEEFLKKLIIFIGLIYSVIYFIAITNPNILQPVTQNKILFERDTARIDIHGYLYAVIGYFMSIDKIYKEKKYYFVFFIFVFLIAIILRGTRAVIFPVGILTLFYLLKNLKKGSILSFSIIIFVVIATGIFFLNILQSLYDLLISTVNMQEGNLQIRLFAVSFFFNYLFPNVGTYILGNGYSSELANFGQEVLYYKLQYGFYQSDIGIIGDYSIFGLLYLYGVFLLIYEIFKQKIRISDTYILYSFYFIIISMITLSHFGVQSEIPAICILLFLYDKNLMKSYK